ncbi:MAG TPA: O-antigen ligase family protein [Bacillota bacterium]|nr:O-antigen ligase family protein [Bacillota bacterium]
MYLALGMIIFSPYMALVPLIYLLIRFLRQGEWVYDNTWTKGLLILFFWSFLVGLDNWNMPSVLASFVLLLFLGVSVYLQDHYQSEQDVEKLFRSVFILSLGSAFIGWLEHWDIITYTSTWWKYVLGTRSIVDIDEFRRIAGTFNNPNLAGTWYAVMIMIGFYFFRRNRGVLKLFYLLGMGVFGSVLMMTESRASVIGLFLGFVIYSYFAGHKKKMLFLMFSLLAGTALMLEYPAWFPRGEILFGSIRDRQAIWENCFHMFIIQPITGWGWFGIYYADSSVYHYARVFHAHNTLLTVAVSIGVVGLGVLMWMLWDLLQQIRVLFQNECRLTPLVSGIIAMIFGQGLFDFTIMSPQICMLLIGSWALTYSLAYAYRDVTDELPALWYNRTRKWKKA